MLEEKKYEASVREILHDHISLIPHSHLLDVQFETRPASTKIIALVRGPISPTKEQITHLEASLPLFKNTRQNKLLIRFSSIEILDKNGTVSNEAGP